MSKKSSKFNSLSTPGHKQDCSAYLVELAFTRQNKGVRLPEFFWRQTRYKFQFKKEIMACRKFIKTYGEPNILCIALNNYITTWTDFARIEYLLQKLAEIQKLRALPKDKSPPKKDFDKEEQDFRQITSPSRRKIGLFERLKEFNG